VSTEANAVTDPVLDSAAAPALARVRPFYWSVRRELWENRSIYVAPIAVAGLVLFGSSLRALTLPHRMRALPTLDLARQESLIVGPYSLAAALVILTAYVVGAFYCLEALHGERRDRSILFWKSLPVSDLTTVLAKAAVPLLVLPAVAFVVSLATQAAMLFWSTFILGVTRAGAVTLWTRLPLVQMTFVMAYGLAVHALWHAPIYAWLLLVSAWARRYPLLWAVLPPIGVEVLERIVFQSAHFASFVGYRFAGAMKVAFALDKPDTDITRLAQLAPLRFLATPGLWLGLLAAALFLVASARLRRRREPI
jgi:ABC-2 type transport system permease protein